MNAFLNGGRRITGNGYFNKMIKPTGQQIKEIAENLDCGMKCYYNKRTGEIRTIIDFDSWDGADEESWEEEIKEIEENWGDYFVFEQMSTKEAFELMVDFAESIYNPGLQERLFNALNRSKPFRNFKWQIDNSGEYRQHWFDFKNHRYIEWVKNQIDDHNRIDDIE